ncbi:hypothetical protein CGT98_13885 [Vibrio metoecus]|nr:hypothetical protein [Vibrio metoecus]PAR38501.1 hypothetical protein CGT98_13885 [Vibrio metoecus]
MLGSIFPVLAQAEPSFDWDWTVSASHIRPSDSSLFTSVTGQHSETYEQMDALLDLQSRWQGWTASLAFTASPLYDNGEQSRDTTFTLSELFWQGEREVAGHSLNITAGKIRLDWGGGYGYRPLDLFLPYRRNPLGIQVEEGAGVLALSSYQGLGEWTLIATDSSWQRSSEAQWGESNEQQGIGLRHYRLVRDSDIQGIVYYDNVRRGLVGGSWVSVLNPAWSVHTSWLYQREYWQYQPQTEHPLELVKKQHAAQFLFGLNWANAAGHNVIAEYWYDGRSWNEHEWQEAINTAKQMHAAGLTQTVASYAQGYQAANIVAHNVMLHWTWDGATGRPLGIDNVTPTIDLLWSAEDGGLIVTPWLNWQAYDSGASSLELELAARFFSGKSDSAYANLPDNARILFNLKGKF